jgi:hypothetical protein
VKERDSEMGVRGTRITETEFCSRQAVNMFFFQDAPESFKKQKLSPTRKV